MCNLTFVSLKSRVSNMAAIYEIATASSNMNGHGWGVYNGGVCWRTIYAAHIVSNAPVCLKSVIKTSGPSMSHTRMASKNVAVSEENVHPFETPHLVGMHNGTLFSKKFGDDVEKPVAGVEDSRPSDSRQFFELLDKELDIEPDMVKALNNVMKECKGKFAFLIYYKDRDQYFVVRGKTADLHHAVVTNVLTKLPVGFIVNTNKRFLEESYNRITNLAQFLGAPEYAFEKSTELKQETIYQFNENANELVEVGTLNENPLPVKPATTQAIGGHTAGFQNSTTTNLQPTGGAISGGTAKDRTPFQQVADWAIAECLTVPLVNEIWLAYFGHSIVCVTDMEVKEFINNIMPRLTSDPAVHRAANRYFLYSLGGGFYTNSGLNFPLAFNKPGKVIKSMYRFQLREKA